MCGLQSIMFLSWEDLFGWKRGFEFATTQSVESVLILIFIELDFK